MVGTQSQITGGTYGKGGKSGSSTPGGANTGNGGGGNKKGSSAGAGGSGVVIVRLTSVEEPDDPPPEEEKTLTVRKTVAWDPDDVSNATIRVWSHVPSAQLDVIAPNVLFIGTMCSAHELTKETVRKSLNAIASKANVDWYLYPTDYDESVADSRRHGSLNKGDSLGVDFENDLSMPTGNHQALKSFYKTIYDVATDSVRSNKYDYIVFEFDGSRLAHKYEKGADYDEAVVARFLTPYYQASNVIWVVDNCSYGTGEPYQGNEYYTPNAYAYGSRVNNFLSDVQYRALIGLMDPGYYFSNTCYTTTREWGNSSYKWTVWTTDTNGKASSTAGVTGKKQVWANRRYEKQITYDNANTLSDYLKENIVQHSCDLKFVDKVVDAGLTIVTAHLYRAESPLGVDELEGWTEIEPPELKLKICGSVVTAVVENVTKELWAKLEIVARDDGTFKTSEGAVLVNGKWKKNPNDGAANVKMTDEAKGDVYAEGDAYTDLSWEDEQGRDVFVAYAIRGVVENGELTINGVKTNELAVSEGYSPVVAYRGDPGCRLESITDATDEGQTGVDVSGHPTEYVVANLRTNHLVTVCYAPVVVDSVPYEGPYDAAGHTIEVDLPEESADLKDFSVKYAFDEEGEFLPADEFGGVTNVGVRTVYYKVYARQSGYAEPLLIASGSNTVTILPCPVEIWANNTNMVYGAEASVPTFRVLGDLVTDEGPVVSLDYTNAIWNAGIYPDAITTNAPIVVTNATGADVSMNYNIIFHSGSLTVEPAGVGDPSHPGDPAPGTGVDFTGEGGSTVPYKGEAWEPEVSVTNGIGSLVEGVDYDIAYLDNTNASDEAVVVITGKGNYSGVFTNYFTITKIPLTVTADDKEVVFGSAVPGASFYTFVYSGFTNGEDVAVLETEPTFGSAYATTTPVGDIAITNATPGVAQNYEFVYVPGTLTVTKDRGFVGPIAAVTYKGSAWEPDLAVINAMGATLTEGADYTVVYHDNTNATDAAYAEVTFVGNYEGVATNYFTIEPKPVTLTSGSKTFTYDGNPHAYTNLAATGFVEGEGLATTSDWATVTSVAEGEVDNTFAYTLADGTLAGNYDIAVTTGKISVVAAPVDPKNPSGPAANPDDKPTSAEPATLWAENVVKMYDGVGTNVLPQVYNAVAGNGFTYEYSTNETDWVTDLAFTNVVTAQKVYFRAIPQGDTPNYLPTNCYAYVTITNRPVTITFAAADKVYDGSAAAVCTATNFENVVEGEGFALDMSAMAFAFDSPDVGSGKTVTATGYDDALLSPVDETLASNYAFTFVPTATASVTKALQTVTSEPYDGTYDGEGHTIGIDPDGGTIEYLVDGIWVVDAPTYAGVVATSVVFRVKKDGHEDFVGTNTVTVSARPVSLTSGDRSFVFDGTAHMHHALTGVDGFVPGETFTTNWLCSITDVGTTNNEFSIAFTGTAKAENYALTTSFGTLEVTPASVGNPSHPGDPAPGTGVDFTGEGCSTVPYKGEAWEPEVVCTNLFATLVEGVDYDIAYLDNTNATDAAVIVITGKGNYSGVFTNYFTITKIPLTVTADDKGIVYGSTAPGTDFYTFAYSGFTNGEDVAVLEAEPTFGSAYSSTTPVGTLGITNATPGVARNYEFVYVDGTLSVTKALQTVTSSPYSGTYDGEGHTITVDPDGGTVVYLVDNAWIDDAPLYTNRVEATNVVFRVTKDNYETFEGTNTVTVTRRAAALESGSKTFTYDGNPHAYTNLTAEGFVEGEGLATTSDWATVTNVAEGEGDNTFAYTLADGTLVENYVITVETGKISVVAAPVLPKNPTGDSPAENPDDKPAADAGVMLWAENVVKVYDGVGTNVVPLVCNAVEGNGFTFLYSTNETDWVADLAFTNVTEGAQKVFFRATPDGENYVGTNGYAFVTITPAEIGIAANPLVVSPGMDETAALAKMSTATNGTLVAGNEIVYTLGWTNDFSYAEVAPGVTCQGAVLPVGAELQGNYKVVFTAADLTMGDTVALTLYIDDKVVTYGDAVPTDFGWKLEGGNIRHDCDEVVDWTKVSGTGTVSFAAAYQSGDPSGTYAINTNSADVTSAYYAITIMPGTLTVKARSIGPVPENPEHPEGPYKPAAGFEVSPIDPLVYDGQAREPEVVVTNGSVGLVREVDYTVAYFNNTNATEQAYGVIVGIGNYGGCFTNYFTILPRDVTLRSGTKTMYLDLEKPGEPVVCSNGLVWVESGSFVTNAVTGVLDGFEATVPTSLESATPDGPIENEFTVVVSPGLETNYCFTLDFGELAILGTPTNAHAEIHEELPVESGEGVLDVVMDNKEAGPYAANRPMQLDEVATNAVDTLIDPAEKGPTDDYEVRMLVSTNYLEDSFIDVSNVVVRTAKTDWGKTDAEIGRFIYDALDITVELSHYKYDADGVLAEATTNDIGDKITRLLEIHIPFKFHPKMVSFSIWRHHVSDEGATSIVELPYHEGDTETESFATNGTEIVLYMKKFSMPMVQQELQLTPMLTGRMRWKYQQADNSFWGALDVTCTNGDPTAIQSICYVYPDSDNCYLRNPAYMSTNRLSETSSETYDGEVFGKVVLDDDFADILRTTSLNTTNRYGVSDATLASSANRVSNVGEMRIALYRRDRIGLINAEAEAIEHSLGYLVWQENDTLHWCRIEGPSPDDPDPIAELDPVVDPDPIVDPDDSDAADPNATGVVTYPKTAKNSAVLKANATAMWKAKANAGCVFAGWTAAGATIAAFEKLSANERKSTSLKVRIAADEKNVRPEDLVASWAWIDEDRLGAVELTATLLVVESKSYVTATVSGLPKGLKFNSKTLEITGTPTKNETKTVKVVVRNASGYTFTRNYNMTVSGGVVTDIRPAPDEVRTGVPVLALGDAALGKVTGSKVYVAGKTATVKATSAKNCVFLGWYRDSGFTEKAGENYRAASQTIVVTGDVRLYARFVKLESWTIGTFDGSVILDGVPVGTITFTVSNKGKVSGKVLTAGETLSFSAAEIADYDAATSTFVLYPTIKAGGRMTIHVFAGAQTGLGEATVVFDEDADLVGEAYQNGWKLANVLPAFATDKASKAALTLTKGELTLAFGAKGVVTVKGELADGTKVSAKSQLVVTGVRDGGSFYETKVTVYVAPNEKRGFEGFCATYAVDLCVVNGKIAGKEEK